MLHKCGYTLNRTQPVKVRQDRKPGLNPYESALSVPNGWTEPKPCCPGCNEYLSQEEINNLMGEE